MTLGNNPTLAAGSSITVSNVTDAAGNTLTTLTGAVQSTLLDKPGAVSISNVTSDNVISTAERGASQNITINLKDVKAGDVVKLYLDGVQVGSDFTVSAAAASTTATIAVPANGWGADGERALYATVTRGGVTSTSLDKHVYVRADGAHWSTAANALWMDPEAIANAQIAGTTVSTWSAANVSGVDFNASSGQGPNIVVDANGRSSIVFDADTDQLFIASGSAQIATFANYLQSGSSAYTVISSIKMDPSATGSYRFYLSNNQTIDNTAFRLGVNADKLRLAYKGSSFEVSNAASASVWNVVTNTATGLTSGLGALSTLGTSVFLNGSSVSGVVTDYTGLSNPNYGNTINVGQGNGSFVGMGIGGGTTSNVVTGGSTFLGILGDMVFTRSKLNTALRQEIDAYIEAKYGVSGIATALRMDNTYDLSVSKVSTVLLDNVLDLSGNKGAGRDQITTMGSDFVLTGSGNDTVTSKDLAFRQIDGGMGMDTFALDSNYNGSNNMVLADFVSNAEGVSGGVSGSANAADIRVNAAGFHKLMGFEVIDLSKSTAAQTLTVAAADVNQLSDLTVSGSNALYVIMGSNDVIKTSGFSSAVPTYGYWTQTMSDGSTAVFDRLWTGTDSVNSVSTNVALYTQGGQYAPGFTNASYNGTTLSLVFDKSITGSTSTSDWTSFSGGLTDSSATLSGTGNVNLALTLSGGTPSGVLSFDYVGSALQDAAGQGLRYSKFMVGTSATNSMDASANTAATALFGNGGNDSMLGGSGSDLLLVGGSGTTSVTGNGGADVFKWASYSQGATTVTDFNLTQGDKLDLQSLLSGLGMTSSNISNYLSLTTQSTNAVLQVDTSGTASFANSALTILLNNQASGSNTVGAIGLTELLNQKVILT